MQELYLIRHGQAGLRDDYDRLSDLGHKQAVLLAEWFKRRGTEFDVVLSGGLRRQRETASALSTEAEVDALWNEFDLDATYAFIAPQLASVDETFRAEYEAIRSEAADPLHPVHRSWRPSDIKVIQSWVAGRFPAPVESWSEFRERIHEAMVNLSRYPSAKRIALFTSATPIGISAARIFGAPESHIFQLAGALHNTSFSVFRRSLQDWTIQTFNNTPHLEEDSLRTLR